MNFINILNHILRLLEWVVAQLLTLSHHALVTFGMTAGPSPAWGIAIMCLVLVIRICLLPLFLSQMRAMQRIQVLQPQIQRIQHKYAARKDPRSKEAMQHEIMALQQRHNANPLGSCLPSLIQAPILCSLFYTLQSLPAIADGNAEPLGGIDHAMAGDIESSSIFGVRIADSFGTVASPQSRIIIGVAVALMCLTLFAIQWMLIRAALLVDQQSVESRPDALSIAMVPNARFGGRRAQGQARPRAGQPSPCRSRSAIPRGGACDGRPRGGESPTRARKVGRQPQPQTTQNPTPCQALNRETVTHYSSLLAPLVEAEPLSKQQSCL